MTNNEVKYTLDRDIVAIFMNALSSLYPEIYDQIEHDNNSTKADIQWSNRITMYHAYQKIISDVCNHEFFSPTIRDEFYNPTNRKDILHCRKCHIDKYL